MLFKIILLFFFTFFWVIPTYVIFGYSTLYHPRLFKLLDFRLFFVILNYFALGFYLFTYIKLL